MENTANLRNICLKNAPKSKGGLNLPEIVALLRNYGLPTNGLRDTLKQRLCEHVKLSKNQPAKARASVPSRQTTPKPVSPPKPAPSKPAKPVKSPKQSKPLVIPSVQDLTVDEQKEIRTLCTLNYSVKSGGLNLYQIKAYLKRYGQQTQGKRDDLKKQLCEYIERERKAILEKTRQAKLEQERQIKLEQERQKKIQEDLRIRKEESQRYLEERDRRAEQRLREEDMRIREEYRKSGKYNPYEGSKINSKRHHRQ